MDDVREKCLYSTVSSSLEFKLLRSNSNKNYGRNSIYSSEYNTLMRLSLLNIPFIVAIFAALCNLSVQREFKYNATYECGSDTPNFCE